MGQVTSVRSRFGLWIIQLLLLVGFWLALSHPLAYANTQPRTCQIGIYLTSLKNFNPSDKTFGADFWLWSLCPSADLTPLQQMDIVDSSDVTISYDASGPSVDKFGSFGPANQPLYWSQHKVSATLHHDWSAYNYPFDRHVLQIAFEDAQLDSSSFVYTSDVKGSNYNRQMPLKEWKITDFQITTQTSTYETTFGDPELPPGESSFSRLLVSIALRRNNVTNFFKLTAGVYAAFATVLLAFFLDPLEEMEGRTGLLVGSLFAVLVSMQGIESLVGQTTGLTLIDIIHVITLVYIFVGVGLAVYSRRLHEENRGKRALFLDRHVFVYLFAISYSVINLILITGAI